MSAAAPASRAQGRFVGQAVPRLEDPALLRGRGRFLDDLPVKPGTLHGAILRSPQPHAEILSIDTSAALRQPGVVAVITREHVLALTDSFIIGLTTPLEYYSLAVDRVRYVGEPVAMVVASDRYRAEDALDHITVEYRPLPVAMEPVAAARADAPVLHPKVGSNVIVSRHYVHGDVEGTWRAAPHRTELTVRYPRNSIPPMEGYAVLAEHLGEEEGYDTVANFQGPFSMHPVMARALRVDSGKFRLRIPPNSGGSFGVKLTLYPYIVLACLAARLAGRPVKWIEDRLEHLAAANSIANRVTEVGAAHDGDGNVRALRYHHWDDHGAYLRAPMPAPTIRMHGLCTGAYRIPVVEEIIDVVATNKTPTGAVRGFGAPQLYFALERTMHEIAAALGKDPLEVMRRNLIAPDAFPYRAPGGSLYDSGDYDAAIDYAVRHGRLGELKSRREEARAHGRLYGIGYAAVVDPGQSNMGYIATVKTREERRRAGPKNGAIATAMVAVDPLGSVSVTGDSAPQGQGHRTVLAQIVADQLGLKPEQINVNLELDTQKDGWSIAAGNYACRFGPVCSSAAHMAATKIRDKLARIAAPRLNVRPDVLEFDGGRIYARDNPENGVSFARVAGEAHWSPGTLPADMTPGLRETVQWSPPELTPTTDEDQINSMLVYGFGFDFCGVELDRDTGEVCIDRYVTVHDCGPVLNPGIANGQIGGSFAYGVNAALFEEFCYAEDGSFLSGTYADYLVATAHEMPRLVNLHPDRVTASPFTSLGAKGISEGNTNSTPVCIANAVADALGVRDIVLPLTPARIFEAIHASEPARPAAAPERPPDVAVGGRMIAGTGELFVHARPERVWAMLLDPEALRRIIPGCQDLEVAGAHDYRATVTLGAGPVKGRFAARVRLTNLVAPRSATLGGTIFGPLGSGSGEGEVVLDAEAGATRVRYRYRVRVTGKVAAVGGRMLDGAVRLVIRGFFNALLRETGGRSGGAAERGWWQRLFARRTQPR